MDDFQYVRTLRGAIYGKVALVRHQGSGGLYAVKMMSIAHMSAHTAIAGVLVREDGDAELRILRRLSGNRVFSYMAPETREYPSVLPARLMTWSVNPLWDASELEPGGDGNQMKDSMLSGSSRDNSDRANLLWLHKDFVDARTNVRCLVFEYCPNGELFDHVRGRALSPERARGFFQQIARAVRFVHAHGVAHRDISLENVLVDAQLQCRLADFGLASEDGVACKGRVGKTFYMAPEVLLCEPHECYDGLKSDVWSLGVLLFIMVTGAPPFETAAESDARFRVVKHQGLSQLLCIWQMDSHVSGDLLDLLARMLTVDANARISIEKVCSHSWVLDDGEAESVLGDLVPDSAIATEQQQQQQQQPGKQQEDVDVARGHAERSELKHPEQHLQQLQQPGHEDSDEGRKELEKEPVTSAKLPADGAMKTRRTRKRMKISIEPDSANLLLINHSNNNEGLCAVASASSHYPVRHVLSSADGDGKCGASHAPALAHEENRWGGAQQDLSALFAPYSTPTAGARVRASGGRKVALRNLCFTPSVIQATRSVCGARGVNGSSNLAVASHGAANKADGEVEEARKRTREETVNESAALSHCDEPDTQ